MKADTLKFLLKGRLNDEGCRGGEKEEREGNIEENWKILCVPLEKSPSSLKYHLTHGFSRGLEEEAK